MRSPSPQDKPPHAPLPYPARSGTGPFGSFLHAWNGLVHSVVHQRNMQVHMVAATLVGLVGSGIPLGLAEKVTLIFCVVLVFFAEILNSALEHLVDLAVQQFDEKARLAKDAAAAGVLTLAIGTVVIFAALVVYNWPVIARHGPQIGRQVLLGVPLASSVALLITKRPKPLWLDLTAFIGGCALMLALALQSMSSVFSALTFGLLLLAGAAARERHRAVARKKETRSNDRVLYGQG